MKVAEKIIVIVCDDIREEVAGKISLMGIYHDLQVDKFPAVLSKLCASIMLEGVKIKVNSVDFTMLFPGDQPRTIALAPPDKSKKIANNINLNVFIVPLQLLSEGLAKFEIIFNGDEKTKFTHEFQIRLRKE